MDIIQHSPVGYRCSDRLCVGKEQEMTDDKDKIAVMLNMLINVLDRQEILYLTATLMLLMTRDEAESKEQTE